MIYRYLGLCIPGAEELCADILARRLKDMDGLTVSGGSVAFSTAVPYSDLNLFCFNNIFRVLYTAPAAPTPAGLENFLRAVLSAPADWSACRDNPKGTHTFRLVTSCCNRLTAVPRKTKSAAENRLRTESGLKPDRSLPDSEFWAMVRADGTGWLLKRLTRHKAYDKLLSPGELHPELCYMMCWLSDPKPRDIVADPFCGHGAIPLQRCKRFPFSHMYAFDTDDSMLASTRKKLPRRENIHIKKQDALALTEALLPNTVDAFITDPPWGLYQDVGMSLGEFYIRALSQMADCLKPGGRIVLLTAAKEALAAALDVLPSLTPAARYDILVSGKKAALLLLQKGTLQEL